MARRVEIMAKERVLDDFFQVDRYRVRYETYDGQMSAPLQRLVFERGDSVAVLPYDRERGEVVLVQQFRLPAYIKEPSNGWLWEAIAGTVEPGRTPRDVAVSEAMEEAGYRLESLRQVMTVYPSPGGASERIHIYLSAVTGNHRVAKGGGLPGTGEDILTRTFSLERALAMIDAGEIIDAKTVLALQYLAMHWDEL